ncbi:hypothetical protein Tco_0369008 [Tanacetum coccineum]
MAPTTRRGQNTLVNNTNPNNMTPESIQALIDQALLRNSTNGDGSHSSHGDNRRNVQTARPYFYADFMKCQPLNFKGTEGVVGLTRWIEKGVSFQYLWLYYCDKDPRRWMRNIELATIAGSEINTTPEAV